MPNVKGYCYNIKSLYVIRIRIINKKLGIISIGKYYHYWFIIIFYYLSIWYNTNTQNCPIHVVTEISPPNLIYLSDYSASGNDRLKINIYVINNNLINYNAKPHLVIEEQNITIEIDPSQIPPPLLLQGSIPEILFGSDLDWYFSPDHLIFMRLNKYDFMQTVKLPEGQDFFKNNAFSEAQVFTNGDECKPL